MSQRNRGCGVEYRGFQTCYARRGQMLTIHLTETVDDLMKLACALTKRRAASSSQSKNGAPFECAITDGQTRW